MLIQIGGRFLNTDHIVSVETEAAGSSGSRCTVTLSTGQSVLLKEFEAQLEKLCGVVVPAPVGLRLVEAYLPSARHVRQEVGYRITPIVAFRILEPGDAPMPVGLLGEPRDASDALWAVLQPDGQCSDWERIWDSLEEFKADCEQRASAQGAPAALSKVKDAPPPGIEPSAARQPAKATAARPEAPKPSDSADPVAALRTRIVAEPIRPVSDDALWRPGQQLDELIDAVRRAHPNLHAAGIGYDARWGWKWKPGDQERERSSMTSSGHVAEFERALRFLSHVGRQFAQQRVNRKRSSYSWKHAAERVMGDYVQNGMLIAAAYALGYRVEAEAGSPNAYINLSEAAVALDPGKGMT